MCRQPQSALAQLADVGRQWLNAFEMGDKASAPLDMVMRTIAALDVSVTLSRPVPPARANEEEPADLGALIDGVDAWTTQQSTSRTSS